MKIIDLSNQRFFRLVVICDTGERRRGQVVWSCKCDCGKMVRVCSYSLRSGAAKSCRCYGDNILGNATRLHGKTESTEYNSWCGMMSRCYNSKNPKYQRYGKRGIRVCRRWHSATNFLKDMGPRPSPTHSIDRIDNDGNYSPNNCRWATLKQQGRNRSNNRILTKNGVSLPVCQWISRTGLCESTIYRRLRRGLTHEEVLS